MPEEALSKAGVMWDKGRQVFLFNVNMLTARRLKKEVEEEEYTAVCLLAADRAGA